MAANSASPSWYASSSVISRPTGPPTKCLGVSAMSASDRLVIGHRQIRGLTLELRQHLVGQRHPGLAGPQQVQPLVLVDLATAGLTEQHLVHVVGEVHQPTAGHV